ncbi:luciferin 4-monooxygenase [Anabrus simplex]|uniref:luciferin 4-monooxygenase n=1 Tax=Anabrus simplex TaxID=316456 RepID=UPI0035A2D3FA
MRDDERVLYGPRDDQPLPDIPLGHFILERLKQYGDKIAQIYVDSDETYTFSDLVTRAVSVAEELHDRGVQPGDVIAVITKMSSDFTPLLVGGLLVGAVTAPLSPSFDNRVMTALLKIYQPKYIFCDPNFATAVEQVIPHLDSHPELLQFGRWSAWDEFIQRRSSPNYNPMEIPSFWEREAIIMCSSGTTGFPKGVILTHKSILAQMIVAIGPHVELMRSDDTVLQLSPIFWISGLFQQLLPLVSGATVVILSSFSADKILKTIQEYKVTELFVSPNLAVMLAKTPSCNQYDLSTLRFIMCSSTTMSGKSQAMVETALNSRLSQWYATTEAIMVLGHTSRDQVKKGSSGRLQPRVKAKVVDLTTGKCVGPMVWGELCISSPWLTKGYYGNSKAMVDDQGWFHTGDMVYYDEDECFYVVDRISDIIKYKDKQISPSEIEELLMQHPGVKDAAVMGFKCKVDHDECLLTAVIRKLGSNVTEKQLVEYLASNMEEHKWLKGGVIFMESIPRTPTGKIQRHILREQINQGKKESRTTA